MSGSCWRARRDIGPVVDYRGAGHHQRGQASAVDRRPTGRDDGGMTDDEVLDHAPADGFELVEPMSAGQWAVDWARGADDRWPCFLAERQALTWMRDRLKPRARLRVMSEAAHVGMSINGR
jgi:hypothetical protein